MRATIQTLQELAAEVGAGDHVAFRRLYAKFAPETLAFVDGEIPDPVQSMNVVRATFYEVWWMCAFDLRCGTARHDVPLWIAGIARRRSGERRQALELIGGAGQAKFWSGLLADHDQWTRFELATMLDGHDTIRASARLTKV